MKLSDIIRWYSKLDVQKEIISSCENKEVAYKLKSGSFGKRPNILQYPNDILNLVRIGATSFHISIENWDDPLKLNSESSAHFLREQRNGWDLIIDIDCDNFEYSKKTARIIIEYLKSQNIKNFGIKFSGNKGWHIIVPSESFPSELKNGEIFVSKEFPKIFERVLKKIKKDINDYLNNTNKTYFERDIKTIYEKLNKKLDIDPNESIDYLKLMDIDLAMASPRHLIRSPYSINEKSGLVSVVINESEIESFSRADAKIENIKKIITYIDRSKSKENEAKLLFSNLNLSEEEENKKYNKVFEKLELNSDFFPPCIKKILNGVNDGKKRSLFALINFYKNFEMSWDQIENEISDWNKKNSDPLKEGYIKSQIDWHKKQHKIVPPPNCKSYYKEIGVCSPDTLCNKIKNPLSYTQRKSN